MNRIFAIFIILSIAAMPALCAEKPKPAAKSDAVKADAAKVDDVKFKEPVTPVAEEPKAPELAPYNERNAAALDAWIKAQKEMPCGIACPKCATELLRNMVVLLNTAPPMAVVRCPKEGCGFSGAIY